MPNDCSPVQPANQAWVARPHPGAATACAPGNPVTEARQLVHDYLVWECVVNGPDAIVGAFARESRYRISLWDSLIVHAADVAEAENLLSVTLISGQRHGDVLVENPFNQRAVTRLAPEDCQS